MEYGKEYFKNPYYFYLVECKDDISVYFSYSETLTESRKNDDVVKFSKKDKPKLEKEIKKIIKARQDKSTKEIKNTLLKTKDELEEIVDANGSFKDSSVPILNPKLAPKGTLDQEVVQTMQPGNPLWRGYRVYWGESEEKGDDVVSEINLSGTFGREETENLSGPETFKTYVKELGMSPDDAKERTLQQGKTPDKEEHKKKLKKVPKKIKDDPNYIDTLTLVEKRKVEESRKTKALQMVEDILNKKKDNDGEIRKKSKNLTSLITKNLSSLKKLAKKEGISINELIKILKSGE